jgi:hypothetical protein
MTEENAMNSVADSSSRHDIAIKIGPAKVVHLPELIATGTVLAATAVSPLMFVAVAAGYGSMNFYAKFALLPAIAVVLVIAILARIRHWKRLGRGVLIAAIAGPLATLGLEVIRIIGFRVFHAMPGSMPMLMGVLITDRTLLGPDIWSNLVGWGDHVIINGTSFALVYVLLFGRQAWWKAIPYAWFIATIFMLSPDMTMLGNIGDFGLAMGPGFAITVYLAHTVFGLILGIVVSRSRTQRETLWRYHLMRER